MKSMGIAKYVDDHPFLGEIRAKALREGEAKGRAKGKAEGLAEGIGEGKLTILHNLLDTKFGPLPKWALSRVRNATPAQVERWAKKVLTAESLEETLGRR